MLRNVTIASALLLTATAASWAQEEAPKPSLGIGDQAPAIEIAHWLKGDEVATFENGNVYVVEFWATWCGPCKASMPHISKLQKQYRDYDVTFIGISDEELAKVEKFMAKEEWDAKTQYTIATDPDRSVYTDYMTASGQRGIPTAFIVGKDTKIEWIGHPMEIDAVIEKVVTDGWDRDTYRDTVIPLQKKLGAAMRNEDYDKVLTLADELEATGMVDSSEYAFQKFSILLQHKNDPAAAYAIGKDLVKKNWDNSAMLNAIAWFTVDSPGIEERDLDFALKAADRANELTHGKDPAILDTVARVHYEQGDLATAIKIQKKAVEHAEGPMADQLREALKKYESEAGM